MASHHCAVRHVTVAIAFLALVELVYVGDTVLDIRELLALSMAGDMDGPSVDWDALAGAALGHELDDECSLYLS
jgi:hypothetical protein